MAPTDASGHPMVLSQMVPLDDLVPRSPPPRARFFSSPKRKQAAAATYAEWREPGITYAIEVSNTPCSSLL